MAARFLEDERLAQLLADRAVEGLGPEAQDELDRLAARYPDFEADALDQAAAAVALAGLRVEALPAHLRARIESDARAHFGPADVVPLRPKAVPAPARGAWLALAASVVLAAVGWWRAESLEAEATRLAAARSDLARRVSSLESDLRDREARPAELAAPDPGALATARAALAARPGTVAWTWTPTGDPAAGSASGDVVWNGEAQRGFMRFRGLAANDPAAGQYQLWIFDAARDERYPVDGGVFDVPEGADEVIVPIRAKLPVARATLFAVTVEPPGGVVVSSRERIAVVARPGA